MPVHVTVGRFSPTTQLSGGNQGLIWTQGSVSTVTITGSGLSNGLPVSAVYPIPPATPTIQWTGTTANTNADGTQCTAELTEQLPNSGPGKKLPLDTPITVTVTVSTSVPINANINTGTAPS
jgi:hypothetical protein